MSMRPRAVRKLTAADASWTRNLTVQPLWRKCGCHQRISVGRDHTLLDCP